MAMIIYIWKKRKMKAYKTDRTNQGEAIHIFLQSSAFVLLLCSLPTNEYSQFWKIYYFPSIIYFQAWGSDLLGKISLIVPPSSFLLSPVSQHHNLNPAILQRHNHLQAYAFFTQPLTWAQPCSRGYTSCFLYHCSNFLQWLPTLLDSSKQRYGPLPSVYTLCILLLSLFVSFWSDKIPCRLLLFSSFMVSIVISTHFILLKSFKLCKKWQEIPKSKCLFSSFFSPHWIVQWTGPLNTITLFLYLLLFLVYF